MRAAPSVASFGGVSAEKEAEPLLCPCRGHRFQFPCTRFARLYALVSFADVFLLDVLSGTALALPSAGILVVPEVYAAVDTGIRKYHSSCPEGPDS